MIFFTIIVLVLIEIFLRSLKQKNDRYENIKRVPSLNLERYYKVQSNSGHSQNSKESKILGWDLIENSHIDVEISVPYFEKKKVEYYLNNVAARSNKGNFFNKDSKNLIGYFGCSITYGHGLNNEKTFSYKLFEKTKDFEYLNFAVPGYSAYQSLLKFKSKLKEIKFNKIVLGIHRDLERRNTCSISWSKIINNVWSIPFVLNIFGHNFKFKPKKRFDLNLFDLKLIKLFNNVLNSIVFSIGSSRNIQKQTMRDILREFKKLCSQNNIELIIICLEDYHEIYDFLSENSFNWTTSNLNLNEKDENNKFKWQLLPWDNHPNEKANEIYFEKLDEIINSNQRPFIPKNIKVKKEVGDQEYIYPVW